MAITPAHRVSKALRAAGFNPGHPSTSHIREGVYVSNALADIPRLAHVTVSVAIDMRGKALRMAAEITDALTSAGYTVIPNPHLATILNVYEPGRTADIPTGGAPAEPPAPTPPATATTDLVARMYKNGSCLVHAADCPALEVRFINMAPGEPVPLKARTREEIVAELFGDEVTSGRRTLKWATGRVKFHDCSGLREEKPEAAAR